MFQIFRLSVLIAIFSLCGPHFFSKSNSELQTGISWTNLKESHLFDSTSFFEPDNGERDPDNSPEGFSFQAPDFEISILSKPSHFFHDSTFLSDYEGRLQFLNIPPPQSLA